MSSSSKPEWPQYSAGPADHAHALGILSINYNNLEWIFLILHHFYNGAPHQLTSFIFEKIPTNVRLEWLKKTASIAIKDTDIRECVELFAKGFEICATNRNTLLHSQVLAIREGETLLATKRSRKDGLATNFEFKLDVIRRVADEIHEWYRFGNLTAAHAFYRENLGNPLPAGAIPVGNPTLPGKPDLPASLLEQSPPSEKSNPRPPRPSSASRRSAALTGQKK